MRNVKIISAILLVVLCIAGVFFVINKNIFEAQSSYKAYEEKYKNLVITYYSDDDFYNNLANEYKELLTQYKNSLNKKGLLAIPKIQASLDEKATSLEKYDKVIVNEVSTKLQNIKNTKTLFKYETAQIEKTQSKAGDLEKSGNYNLAYINYFSALSSFEKVSKENLQIVKYDFSEFPKVKAYIDSSQLEELLGTNIDGEKFKIVEKVGDDYEEIPISGYSLASEGTGLNIDLITDISASMAPYFNDVKTATANFVQNIDLTQNKVGLIAFSDYCERISNFTNDKDILNNAIVSLELKNMTSLYDTLAVSLDETNLQDGAKSIIAFTDGNDNKSYTNDYNTIIDLAKSYDIPIYIIGIGDLNQVNDYGNGSSDSNNPLSASDNTYGNSNNQINNPDDASGKFNAQLSASDYTYDDSNNQINNPDDVSGDSNAQINDYGNNPGDSNVQDPTVIQSYASILQNICNQTGGYYQSLDNSSISQKMLELYQNILTTQNQLYYIEYSDKNEDESQKRELYIEYSNDDITVRNQLNDTVEIIDKDSSLGEIGKKSAVASFMKKANLLYFSALNNRDIQIVEGIYDSESESGRKRQSCI